MMPKNSIVPTCDVRCPTGGLRIGDDWPGLFIRGDDALSIRVGIGSVLNFIMETNRTQFEQGTIPLDVLAGLGKLSTLFDLIKKDVLVSAPDGWSKSGRNPLRSRATPAAWPFQVVPSPNKSGERCHFACYLGSSVLFGDGSGGLTHDLDSQRYHAAAYEQCLTVHADGFIEWQEELQGEDPVLFHHGR